MFGEDLETWAIRRRHAMDVLRRHDSGIFLYSFTNYGMLGSVNSMVAVIVFSSLFNFEYLKKIVRDFRDR